MAGSQRVQMYLEKHKIGALFEELMGKVISDQPDDPLVYLIRSLERKTVRQSHVRRSGDADGVAVPKERGYEKPWQTASKKTRPRDSSGDRVRKSTGSKPDWDHRIQTSGTFDELWDDGRKSRGQRSGSPTRKPTAQSWVENVIEDDYLYSSHGYSGPRHHINESDPLAAEFGMSKEEMAGKPTANKYSTPKTKGLQQNSMKHKQQLEKLILSKKTAEDSGIEEDRDGPQDDAVELMENADDLRNEGVLDVKGSKGVAVRASSRQSSSGDAGVRVSICARCAKVMNGEPSVSAPGVGRYGQLDDSDYEDKDFTGSRPQSAVRFSPESDEEFESVSQVTGPRRPVWQDDSDDESVTPRKGKHMFSTSTVPSKGRPMYSVSTGRRVGPEHTVKPSNLKQAAVQMAQSANFQQSSRGQGHSALNQTWSPNMETSDRRDDKKVDDGDKLSTVQEDEFAPRSASVASGRGGWNVYETDDGASSYYGSPGAKGRKDVSGPY